MKKDGLSEKLLRKLSTFNLPCHFELAGFDRPNISLLSDEFIEAVRRMPSRNLAVELREKLLRDAIKVCTRDNVVQEMKCGERVLNRG